MNWEVLLAMCIWDFTCVVNCSECVSCQTLKSFQLKIERPTRKPVGFMQSCCFVVNGSETKTCLLCNSYLFGMNNVLYIE